MIEDADVIVCGGGPAGLAAALAAARGGARTVLVERLGSLGGIATGAGLVMLCDAPAGPIGEELITRAGALGGTAFVYDPAKHHRPGRIRFHGDTLKLAAARLLRDAGVEVLFHAQAAAALRADGRVAGIEVADKSGRRELRAWTVVDATADADIAASAGAACLPGDGAIQHCNFRCRLVDVDEATFRSGEPDAETLAARFATAVAAGEIVPPPGLFTPDPTCFPFDRRRGRPDIAYWELAGTDPTDAAAMGRALLACQAAAYDALEFCRRRVAGHATARIADLPAMLGTRESRRIAGRSLLTRDDVIGARKHPDGVARGSFWTDLHDSRPGRRLEDYTGEYMHRNRPAEGDWYEIPFGCLVPAGLGHLLVAGRAISADRDAHASARVVPTCLWLGQAAGTAAALASGQHRPVAEVDAREIRSRCGMA